MSVVVEKKLGETVIQTNFHTAIIDNSKGAYCLGEEFVEPIYKFTIQGLADAAKEYRSKEKPAAICIVDIHGNVIFGVKIEFIPGGDEDSGSWNTIWSFNPDDFDDCTKYTTDSQIIGAFFVNRAVTHKLQLYSNQSTAYVLERTAVEVLKQWLDANASPDGTVKVVLDNYFEATVDVVDGIKVFNFIPAEEITNIAKNDGDINV